MKKKGQRARWARHWGLAVISPFVALGLCWAVDREQLGQLLDLLPADGPAEQYGNVTLRYRSKKAGMPPVVFPHWLHRSRYVCSVCHTRLGFAMRSGGSGITRESNLAGKHCGACHNGAVAFSLKEEPTKQCRRCHQQDLSEMNERFREFADRLPTAQFGNRIDWSAALADGTIKPTKDISVANLNPPAMLQKEINLDTTAPRSKVSFSHQKHVTEMDCSTCHPEIFNVKKKGTQMFSMELNLYGQFCGVCHMRVAFPMTDCHRCHPEMSSNSSAL